MIRCWSPVAFGVDNREGERVRRRARAAPGGVTGGDIGEPGAMRAVHAGGGRRSAPPPTPGGSC